MIYFCSPCGNCNRNPNPVYIELKIKSNHYLVNWESNQISKPVTIPHHICNVFTCMHFICTFFHVGFRPTTLPPMFWLLHPRAISARPLRYQHGRDELQLEERSCVYSDRLHTLLALKTCLNFIADQQYNHPLSVSANLSLSKGVPLWSEGTASKHRHSDLSGLHQQPPPRTV